MSFNTILPPATIGIIGGGQLGRMLAISARQMGYGVIILDPKEGCPASQVADLHLIAHFDDQKALKELFDLCDVITYEFENIPGNALSSILEKLPQGTFPLLFTQDRLIEKKTINDVGFKTVAYQEINSEEELNH
ncbi:MAG: hypothetical protein Q7I99_02040, partial [Acholeplasmataceae bacterium]|nr:hypothetical protein [Acholeplasmataceae bacterium]